jgi:cytochrome b6-f complex iron-sulfur subunit
LTPSIITAAEGCPVEVIKFETIEVEGPEPWAGKEAAAAEAGGGGGAAAAAPKKKAVAVLEGPPDPKWAKLLSSAHTSGSRSAGGPAVRVVPQAKAPAEVVRSALPKGAPPDALSAAMVGSGYARPRASVADRIRGKAEAVAGAANLTRRQFNVVIATAWGAMAATGAVLGGALQSFMVPKVTKEPPSSFRAGKLTDYPGPGVYEAFKGDGVWIVYLPEGKLVAVSTICTHLGCIPNWLPGDAKFKCPCHGSGFRMDGVNFEGPAPRPLERYRIALDGDTIIVDKSRKFRAELQQWDLPGAALTV